MSITKELPGTTMAECNEIIMSDNKMMMNIIAASEER